MKIHSERWQKLGSFALLTFLHFISVLLYSTVQENLIDINKFLRSIVSACSL
tara:strand:- start:4120 stop:4275 length:156 start_codon:yes stop_codon:yes gene_type:complete